MSVCFQHRVAGVHSEKGVGCGCGCEPGEPVRNLKHIMSSQTGLVCIPEVMSLGLLTLARLSMSLCRPRETPHDCISDNVSSPGRVAENIHTYAKDDFFFFQIWTSEFGTHGKVSRADSWVEGSGQCWLVIARTLELRGVDL